MWYNLRVSEFPHFTENIPAGLLENQYGHSVDNLKARWQYYELAVDPVDMQAAATQALTLSGNETLLDVGCSDGSYLLRLRDESGHKGFLGGLDRYPLPHTDITSESAINFIQGDAAHLPIADGSLDVITSFFMLYHVDDPVQALHEFNRVLKPDGRLAITTSGHDNKQRHREFEQVLGEYLGLEPPAMFNRTFDAGVALATIPRIFKIVDHKVQRTDARIAASNIPAYYESLLSMRTAFNPMPDEQTFALAIQQFIVPVIQDEIIRNGYFSDTIDRHLFVCEKMSEG